MVYMVFHINEFENRHFLKSWSKPYRNITKDPRTWVCPNFFLGNTLILNLYMFGKVKNIVPLNLRGGALAPPLAPQLLWPPDYYKKQVEIGGKSFFFICHFNVIVIILTIFSYDYVLQWRNWLARSAVNRKFGGSSPPRSEPHFIIVFIRICFDNNFFIRNFFEKNFFW